MNALLHCRGGVCYFGAVRGLPDSAHMRGNKGQPPTYLLGEHHGSDFPRLTVTAGQANVPTAVTQWVQNLNNAAKGLLLLDEFNTSAPSTMKGMLRVVQERYVGDTKLNDSVSIVALMNPIDTAVDAYDLPAPMANRMMHLKWSFDVTNWLENVGTGFQNMTPQALSAMLGSDQVSRKAAVSAADLHDPARGYRRHGSGGLEGRTRRPPVRTRAGCDRTGPLR
jgi:hypothetical protein